MKCSCPKCSSSINIDEPGVPEKGSFSRCPECNSRFWLHREPFLLRAYKKDWKAFCHHCGEDVGPASFCQSCHTPFPDYWVVQASRPVRRKTTYKADFSISLPSRKPRKNWPMEKSDFEPVEKVSATRKPILLAVILLMVVVGLVVGGVKFYKEHKLDSAFTHNYIQTLYGIKSGTDLSFKKLTQISSGKPLSEKEIDRLDMVKNKIDQSKQMLASPPEQFVETVTDLDSLYRVYVDLYSLTLSTAGVSADFREKVESLKSNLNRAEQKLKKDLPDDLMEDVKKVTGKYRNLKFMVE